MARTYTKPEYLIKVDRPAWAGWRLRVLGPKLSGVTANPSSKEEDLVVLFEREGLEEDEAWAFASLAKQVFDAGVRAGHAEHQHIALWLRGSVRIP